MGSLPSSSVAGPRAARNTIGKSMGRKQILPWKHERYESDPGSNLVHFTSSCDPSSVSLQLPPSDRLPLDSPAAASCHPPWWSSLSSPIFASILRRQSPCHLCCVSGDSGGDPYLASAFHWKGRSSRGRWCAGCSGPSRKACRL
jgi:hypothetical protein